MRHEIGSGFWRIWAKFIIDKFQLREMKENVGGKPDLA